MDFIYLSGAENVQSASFSMKEAAQTFQNSVNQFDESLSRHRQFLTDWLQNLEQILAKDHPQA